MKTKKTKAKHHTRGHGDSPFAIDKGVPLPLRGRPGAKYPFPAMEVGDSFFMPLPWHDDELARVIARTSAEDGGVTLVAARQYGERNRQRFEARRLYDENGLVVGVRVWRAA